MHINVSSWMLPRTLKVFFWQSKIVEYVTWLVKILVQQLLSLPVLFWASLII